VHLDPHLVLLPLCCLLLWCCIRKRRSSVIILELLTGRSPAYTTNGMDMPQWVVSILELMRDTATEPRSSPTWRHHRRIHEQ
jgi:hypothetical protein